MLLMRWRATAVQVEMQGEQSWAVKPSASVSHGPEPDSPPIQHITQPWERQAEPSL